MFAERSADKFFQSERFKNTEERTGTHRSELRVIIMKDFIIRREMMSVPQGSMRE